MTARASAAAAAVGVIVARCSGRHRMGLPATRRWAHTGAPLNGKEHGLCAAGGQRAVRRVTVPSKAL